jgi:subtilisin family serine protease
MILDSDSDSGHGTTVVGVVASKSFDLAREVSLYIGQVFQGDYRSSYSKRFAAAISWAIKQEVDVISLSIGDFSFCPILAQQIHLALSKGIVIVASGTNLGNSSSQPIAFPAALGGLICVGSHNYKGKPSSFTPVGKELDFLAPGEGIMLINLHQSNYQTDNQPAYLVENGCSFATPAVAALCAYLCKFLERLPEGNGAPSNKRHTEVVRTMLREVARSGNDPDPTKGYGPLLVKEFFSPSLSSFRSTRYHPAVLKLRIALNRLFPDWEELIPSKE